MMKTIRLRPAREIIPTLMNQSRYCRWVEAIRSCPPYAAALVVLWLALIVPSAFLNALFPIDIGGVFDIAGNFAQWRHWMLSPYNQSGRYVPVYWLYHTVLFKLWRYNLPPYFIVQAGIFLAASWISARILERITRSRVVPCLFVVMLIFSSPNAETLYTICKNEPLVYFFISIILWVFYRSLEKQCLGLAGQSAIAVCFVLAVWSKETALTVAGFAATAAVVACWLQRDWSRPALSGFFRSPYLRLVLAIGAGFVLARLPKLIFFYERGAAGSRYTSYVLTARLLIQNISSYTTQQPDVIGFGILATASLALIARSVLARRDTLPPSETAALAFNVGLLAMAWAYTAIFMIWRWSMGYYLLVPSIFFRFVACYGVYTAIRSS